MIQYVYVAGFRGRGYETAGYGNRTCDGDPPLLRRVYVHASLTAGWHHALGKDRRFRGESANDRQQREIRNDVTGPVCVSAVHPQHVWRHGFYHHVQDWPEHFGQVWQLHQLCTKYDCFLQLIYRALVNLSLVSGFVLIFYLSHLCFIVCWRKKATQQNKC